METSLKNLLSEKKAAILERWFDEIVETYPSDTSNFLKEKKDCFANPVGSTILEGIEGLFAELLNGMNAEKISSVLDNIVRIRAVQDFTPARAVAFIFLLKKVIREELEEEIKENLLFEELSDFESKIDEIALSAFDIYIRCREKLYEIKANEVRSMTFRLLQQANLICEIPEQGQDIKDSNKV